MENLIINRIPVELTNTSLPLYLTCENAFGFIEKHISKIRKVASTDSIQVVISDLERQNPDSEVLYFGFEPFSGAQTCKISLVENRYFIKPFLKHCLFDHFIDKGFVVCKSFVGDLDVWEHQKEANIPDSSKYMVFTIKVVLWQKECYLQIGLGRETHVYNRSVSRLSDDKGVRRILHNQQVYRYRNDTQIERDECYPVLNRQLMNQLNLTGYSGDKAGPHADYRQYYESISSFYTDHLQGNPIDDHFRILSSGFAEVHAKNKFKVNYNRNLMIFKDNNTDVNVFNGIKRYGPYGIPSDISNIKFIFIFYQKDRNLANNFYRYLKSGYRNFPGLNQFVGIQLNLDKENSVVIENLNTIVEEVDLSLQGISTNEEEKFVAIYISPYSKLETDSKKRTIYYRIKELLLKKGITSQVIFRENIPRDSFNYYLPNIAVALLAKIGGIPWKLQREKKNALIVGFGARSLGGRTYVGTTICFDNSGLFKKFGTFEANLDNFGNEIEKAITEYILNLDTPISRLVIHYYKAFSRREVEKVEGILSRLNIDVPYVVLTVNQTRTSDTICFDKNYRELMPMSGTIVQIGKLEEYLLFNNTRYNEYPSTRVDFSYPVKVRISHTKHVDTQNTETVKELIDEVYQFSRMYWRSVRQKSSPVTIEYPRLIADMISQFEKKSLPNNPIASQSLWFI